MSKQLDEKAREALGLLNLTEDEIDELAEKQKALPEEENVVEKEDTEATQGTLKRVWQELSKVFAPKEEPVPDASAPVEARKTDEVQEPEQPE